MSFTSHINHVGVLSFPKPNGVRVMMMPVRMEDADTLPIEQWREQFAKLVKMAPVKRGVAYLTIDEALVRAGETHRRPGLHVDGIGPDGREAAWGGGGGYASSGMLVAASITGCVGWSQPVDGYPGANGNCEHLRDELLDEKRRYLIADNVYECGALAVHEALRMATDVQRSFVRLSLPNDCPWYDGYTRNPLGVEPTGPIHFGREQFMAYRS
jgi:hypothetical protein